MSYIWFNAVLESCGKILNYESVSNMYGRTSFDKKSAKEIQKIIMEANPMHKKGWKPNTGIQGLMGNIKVVETKSTDMTKQALAKQLGDISWAEGLPI